GFGRYTGRAKGSTFRLSDAVNPRADLATTLRQSLAPISRPRRRNRYPTIGAKLAVSRASAVGREGLAPPTPCASCKCATNCANGPWKRTLDGWCIRIEPWPEPGELTCRR